MSEEYEDYKEREEREERYEDEEPRSRDIRRSDQKPGKVQAIAIMTLIGGIYAILWFLGLGGGSTGICCLWPGTYYCLVVGIFGILKGSQLLGANAQSQSPPKGVAIMMIIDIINMDVVCLVLGIIILIFCGDPEVEGYLQGGE